MDKVSKSYKDAKKTIEQRYERYDYYNRIREKAKEEIKENSEKTSQESSIIEKLMNGGKKGFATITEMAKNSYRSEAKILSLGEQSKNKTVAAKDIIENYDSLEYVYNHLFKPLATFHEARRMAVKIENNGYPKIPIDQITDDLLKMHKEVIESWKGVENLHSDNKFPEDAKKDIKGFANKQWENINEAINTFNEYSNDTGSSGKKSIHRQKINKYTEEMHGNLIKKPDSGEKENNTYLSEVDSHLNTGAVREEPSASQVKEYVVALSGDDNSSLEKLEGNLKALGDWIYNLMEKSIMNEIMQFAQKFEERKFTLKNSILYEKDFKRYSEEFNKNYPELFNGCADGKSKKYFKNDNIMQTFEDFRTLK